MCYLSSTGIDWDDYRDAVAETIGLEVTDPDIYVKYQPVTLINDSVIQCIRQQVIEEIAQCFLAVDNGFYISYRDWYKITGAKIFRAKEE